MTNRDRGATLIEVVVALSLAGFALVTVLGGLGSTVAQSVVATDTHTATTRLVAASTALQAQSFVPCAGPTSYDLGPDVQVTSVAHWRDGSWFPACADAVAQRLTVTTRTGAVRSLEVVKIANEPSNG